MTNYATIKPILTERIDLGKDAFLRLLITQLRHQSPYSPLEGREFIVQLAQFVSLEQLMILNDTLSGFVTSTDNTRVLSLLNTKVELKHPQTQEIISGVVKKIIYTEEMPKLVVAHKDGEITVSLKEVISVSL